MKIEKELKNIKVLIALMGLDIGGAETHVVELCKALHDRGVDIYLVSNGGVYLKELEDYGVKHIKAPLNTKKPFSIIKSYGIIKKIIKENNIKLVHAHARIPAFICGLLQKKLGFTFVTTAHLDFSTALPYRMLTNWGQATLAVSEDIVDYLDQYYNIPKERVITSVNGIDNKKYSADTPFEDILTEFNIDKESFKIVYVSRMDKDRSLPAHKLINIAPQLYQKDQNSKLIIVGSGDDFETIKEKTKDMNTKLNTEFIILTGGRIDINKFMAMADIMVGVSRSALEAMACEKPVILAGNQGYIGTFDETKIDRAVQSNFTCRGNEDVSDDNLKEDIFKLMDSPKEKLQELGRYGHAIVLEKYSVERMADDAISLYKMVRNSTREIDAMIVGYYGSDNHGDEVLLKSIIDDLRRLKPNINVVAISRKPKETSSTHGIRSVHKYNFIKIYKLLSKTNTLILGGGSLLQDYTSTKSLVYYVMCMNWAVKAGAKVMLYANGIGPLSKEKNKKRATHALENVEYIALRDTNSYGVLKELGLKNDRVTITADAAFAINSYDKEASEITLKNMGITSDIKFFTVSIRDWKTLKPNFVSEITTYCNHVYDTHGYIPLFISMQPTNDSEIISSVIRGLKMQSYVLDHFSIDEVLGIMERSQFMLGMRLHSVIYASIVGTPSIAISYDPKVSAIMQELKQDTCVSIEDVTSSILIDFTTKLHENKEEIIGGLNVRIQDIADKAMENPVHALDIIDRDIFVERDLYGS